MTIESFDVLSEAEYIKITDHDNQQPIPTANESSEPTDDDISLAPFLLETSVALEEKEVCLLDLQKTISLSNGHLSLELLVCIRCILNRP